MRAPVDAPRATPHGAYAYWRAKSQRRHAGVDLAAKRGASVYAPEPLRVIAVLRGGRLSSSAAVRGVGLSGYGPSAILAVGASGLVHVLGHLDQVLVGVGDQVEEGALVGTVSHLRHVHWEVRLGDRVPWPRATRLADTLDPLTLIDPATPAPPATSDAHDGGGLPAWLDAAQALTADIRRKATAQAAGEVLVLVVAAIVLAHGKSDRR